MRALGYETIDAVVQMKDYGVPQTRRRFILVGWLPGEAKPFAWPEPTHGTTAGTGVLFDELSPWVNAAEAIGDLAWLRPGEEATRYQMGHGRSLFAEARCGGSTTLFNHLATQHRAKAEQLIELIPIGGSIRDVPAHERGTRKLTMTKLDPDRISNTIVSLPDDLLHYAQPRILTVREMARLQTFDDDFVFFGKRTSGFVERRVDVPQYTQVGNAVPPEAGYALGRQLVASLGAASKDLRELNVRRERHQLVLGSSGYSGYELAVDARDSLELLSVQGSLLPLPIATDLVPVKELPALSKWSRSNPMRGQWAPGVSAKELPSWMPSVQGSKAG
jgi:DNA (cytosine-5)-methyltransferase 1